MVNGGNVGNALLNPDLALRRFLDTNGNGTGTKNATGNYSAAPTPFYIQPNADQRFAIYELLVQNSDAGQYGQSVYAAFATALTNGLLMRVKQSGSVVFDLLDGVPIKTNDHFVHVSHDYTLVTWQGSLNSMSLLIQFARNSLVLNGRTQDQLEIVCQDDFTGLIDQTFFVTGRII